MTGGDKTEGGDPFQRPKLFTPKSSYTSFSPGTTPKIAPLITYSYTNFGGLTDTDVTPNNHYFKITSGYFTNKLAELSYPKSSSIDLK